MAEKITVNVPHKMSREDARLRIDQGFGKVQEQIAGKSVEITQNWEGDVMNFTAGAMGQSLTGLLTIFDDRVMIEVHLPWLLASFSGKIEEKLKSGTTLLLEKK